MAQVDQAHAEAPVPPDVPEARPAYEPPRIAKKRSLSRATLFTGTGPSAEGPSAGGPGLVGDG